MHFVSQVVSQVFLRQQLERLLLLRNVSSKVVMGVTLFFLLVRWCHPPTNHTTSLTLSSSANHSKSLSNRHQESQVNSKYFSITFNKPLFIFQKQVIRLACFYFCVISSAHVIGPLNLLLLCTVFHDSIQKGPS